VLLAWGATPATAGDSFYGKVSAVKSADLVVFEAPGAQYDVHLLGVEAAREGPAAQAAAEFVRRMVLGRNARIRLGYRAKDGSIVAKLTTDDPEIGLKDVGLELVRAGLARRQPNVDYKYGELSLAEREARAAKRGLWATTAPR
jgi:endonuclease YncB( thermonuclease family)